MPQSDEALKPLRRFRITAVRIALSATVALALLAYFFVGPAATQGVLLGGIGGVLGFWIIAVRLEKLANMAGEKVHFAALTWTSFRFLLYGAVLFRAYTLDREDMHGLLGATAGLLLIRFVMIFMGLTGIEMPARTPDDTDESTEIDTETEPKDN